MTGKSMENCPDDNGSRQDEPEQQLMSVRKRRKDERPGEIIAAGLAVFADKGFAAARLDDVAKRAGIAKGTIYLYFDNKEALFLAAVESLATPAFADLEQILHTAPMSTRDLLKTLVRKAHLLLADSDLPILMNIIISEGRNFPQLTDLYYETSVARGRKLLAMLMERGIERGELKENAATRLPIVLIAPAIMAAVWGMTFGPRQPISTQDFLEAHIDFLFEGVWVDA